MTMGDLSGLSTFAGQTAGVQSGLQQQALSQQMQQFLLALQFQQQQAAQSQAGTYGTQYGYAPGGNYMTWGAGGPTQPAAGTPTQQELLAQMSMGQGALANQVNMSQVTGQFAAPRTSQFAPGTVLTSPSQQPGMGPAYGVVNADGSVQMATTQQLSALAAQRGTTAQAMMGSAAPVDWNTLQQLAQGPPTAPAQQTLAAQNQQYQQALNSGTLTGQFSDPTQTAAALLQQGKAMDGTAFTSLPLAQQQYWLQYNQNNPQLAAQAWAQGVNGALQQSGYANPAAQPQQTLQSVNQNAQLSGQYQGAPTEAAREFNAQNALGQGQLGQQYLATAASLQGPQNTFQLSNYLRGAQGNPNVPVYLQNLQNNTGMAAFQGTGSTAPTPQSATGLTSQMGYGVGQNGQQTGSSSSATPGWDYNSTLNSVNNIAQQGAQKLGPGSLERLSPDELSAFGSGLGAVGSSLPSFMQQYQNSRVGQSAAPQTALA